MADKGLKMKIKRKNTGGHKSEAKHEIVASMEGGNVEGDDDVPLTGAVAVTSSQQVKEKGSKSGSKKSKKSKKNKNSELSPQSEGQGQSQDSPVKVSSMLNKGRVTVTLNRISASDMKSPGKNSTEASPSGMIPGKILTSLGKVIMLINAQGGCQSALSITTGVVLLKTTTSV